MKGILKLFDRGNIYMPWYAYGCVKLYYRNHYAYTNFSLSMRIQMICQAIFFASVLYILLWFCAVYYEIINLFLWFKHGKNYVGTFEGPDVLYLSEGKTFTIINNLFLLDTNGDSCDVMYDVFTDFYTKLCKSHDKLGSLRGQLGGYLYYYRAQFDMKDFVKYMEHYDNEDELKALLDKYGNTEFPMENRGMFQFYVGKTPIKWKRDGNDKLQFPVFIKYHHCVGDGLSIVAMMTTNLMENGVELMRKKCEIYGNVVNKNYAELPKEINVKYFGPVTYKELGEMHPLSLGKEKILCWALENNNNKYVDKVKRIKSKLAGLSFSDVMITAVSASLSEHCMKYNKNPQKSFRTAVTKYMSRAKFEDLVKIENGEAVANLNNKFSAGMLDLPIKDDDIDGNLLQRLRVIADEIGVLRQSLDIFFLYWQLTVPCQIVPVNLLKYSILSNDSTVLISNVPGNTMANITSGHTVRDTVFWPPNFVRTGISFSIFTYDNLFRLGLIVDKKVISSREQVQTIVDNVFKYIDKLDAATRDL